MSFSDHKIQTFTKKIQDLPDQPNLQPDELKAYFDSSPEELRESHNALCDALGDATAAANLGFSQTAGVPETNVQDAIENVQSQVTAAIVGSIPSGSIDGDKLAQDVRNRLTNIETAATTEASTRASADSNLQSQINTHTTQIASKCEVVLGTYQGDNQSSKFISLGFTPKAVLVTGSNGLLSDSIYYYGGFTLENFPTDQVAIETNGFRVYYSDSGSRYKYTNTTDTHYFLAIK